MRQAKIKVTCAQFEILNELKKKAFGEGGGKDSFKN
jgi:hypothetical protein